MNIDEVILLYIVATHQEVISHLKAKYSFR